MKNNTSKYNSPVKLIDVVVLGKEISKEILFREYGDKLKGEFYELDHNGVEKINANGEKILTDKAVYVLFQLYTYYLGVIQDHKEPESVEDNTTDNKEPEEEDIKGKDPNVIIKWIRDILNTF